MSLLRNLVIVPFVGILLASTAFGRTTTLDVSFDRWMYPFNTTPGTRATGSSFGAIGSDGFDDRDAQVVFGFDVSATAPRPGENLLSLVLRLSTAAADLFKYDPTVDALDTYTTGTDLDTGRPLELFGVGTRHGFTGLTFDDASIDDALFKEASSFSTIPGQFVSSRSVFSAHHVDGALVDVSNNVAERQEVSPWAVGQNDDLSLGDSVPMNTQFDFSIDLSDSNISDYVHAGMENGALFFALASLHSASREGPPTFPSFYLDAGGVNLGQTATLELEFGASSLPEDFDKNGKVDFADFVLFSNAFDSTEPSDLALFDLNDSGQVDFGDFVPFSNAFGSAAAVAAVPEPVSGLFVYFCFGAALILFRRLV